ncbi:MAG TPA: ADP-glyceromanno-heptose 6-epimerase [Bacteroidales bacterium]|nr:ADP-glyceromanno-heptose 6-epimerase [Bacteroidales bacterium]
MIVITGAAGFIGSNLLARLNEENYKDIVIVDDFSRSDRRPNYGNKVYSQMVDRNDFITWLEKNQADVQFVFHLGARTDTTEFDWKIFEALNLGYSKKVWSVCSKYGIPLVYASSAATYGDGEKGYDDDHAIIPGLKPLNPYGVSKNEFDKWVLQQEKTPSFWAGLKFFNVYGPNEYHKGRMASVVFHAFSQISDTGKMKLFRSHNPHYPDGEQLRDFVYVKDVVDVMYFFMLNRKAPGIYNLGTGKAGTFNELVTQTFQAMGLQPAIEYIDTPADIRDKYQYFTEARMSKLRSVGYDGKFRTLAEGVPDYVNNYLVKGAYR